METKYYVTLTGKYIGGFDGSTGVDLRGRIEVPTAPNYALDIWDGEQWIPYVPPPE